MPERKAVTQMFTGNRNHHFNLGRANHCIGPRRAKRTLTTINGRAWRPYCDSFTPNGELTEGLIEMTVKTGKLTPRQAAQMLTDASHAITERYKKDWTLKRREKKA